MPGRAEYRGAILGKGTVLSNKSNFELWKRDIDDYLFAEDLMEHIVPLVGDRNLPAKPQHSTTENTQAVNIYRIWQRDYYATALALRASIDAALKQEVVGFKDPKQIYDALVEKFYVAPPKKDKKEEEPEKENSGEKDDRDVPDRSKA